MINSSIIIIKMTIFRICRLNSSESYNLNKYWQSYSKFK